jgi:hypothetical protein
LIVFLLLTQVGVPQGMPAVGGYALVGISAILSGVGLWRLKRWGMYFYALFFIVRCVLRFPDLLTGDWYEIFSYLFWAVIWFLVGWYLWKRIDSDYLVEK